MSDARIEAVSETEMDNSTIPLPVSNSEIMRTTRDETPPTSIQQSQLELGKSREAIGHYCTLYPCYFSASRTRAQGRRVSRDRATPNPLAYNLLLALRDVMEPEIHLINIILEPDKTHPKDWANSGRVRVQLFDKETHRSRHPMITTKRHLFNEVAKYLKKHPTKKEDSLGIPIQGLSIPDKFLETEIARPRGWTRINQILPLHSPAVTGGGVHDDLFKAMQADRAGDDSGATDLQNMMQSMQGMRLPRATDNEGGNRSQGGGGKKRKTEGMR